MQRYVRSPTESLGLQSFRLKDHTLTTWEQVGGLPIHELNHLELQFLLLNDFRLSVPVEELEAYGSRLVEFYAREVVAQQMGGSHSSSAAGAADALYMHTPNPTP